jgi:hypothetical protein
MDDRIFVLDLLPVKLESAVCNIGSTKNSSKVNDTFSGLTNCCCSFGELPKALLGSTFRNCFI